MKIRQILEARVYSDADWYQCPQCHDSGAVHTANGPDDYDVEMCGMCDGLGRLDRKSIKWLLDSNIIRPDEVKPIYEATILNRDLVREVKQRVDSDGDDFLIRIPANEAESLFPAFIDTYGLVSWSTEDDELYQYNWEYWTENNVWFIILGWYIPSGKGLIKARKKKQVSEARYIGRPHSAGGYDIKAFVDYVFELPLNPFSIDKSGRLHNNRFYNNEVTEIGAKLLNEYPPNSPRVGEKIPATLARRAHNEFDRYYTNKKIWKQVLAAIKARLLAGHHSSYVPRTERSPAIKD